MVQVDSDRTALSRQPERDTGLAMSQENVEVVRRAIDQYNEAGDLPWDLVDPEVEWVIDPSGNLVGPYFGHDGVRAYLKQLHDALDRLRLEIDEFVDSGASVVALGRMRVHGKRSGITVEQPMALLCRVADGRIVTLRTYIRPAEALGAAGLRQ